MWERSMWRCSLNNSDGKQAGFKWRSRVLNIHRNKTAGSQRDFQTVSAIQSYCITQKKPSWHSDNLTLYRQGDTNSQKNSKIRHGLRQWAWFHRLFASSPHWDFECGVFALKVRPAVQALCNTMWDNILIRLQPKWRTLLYTHTHIHRQVIHH